MRLSQFIAAKMEAILGEWESFAAALLRAAHGMSPVELRDHAQQILEAIGRTSPHRKRDRRSSTSREV